jgi:polysaccharide biosynthesis/export protein
MMNKIKAAFSLFLCLAVIGCAGNTGSYPAPAAPQEYVLGIGDTVNIVVYGQPDMTGEFVIDANGALSLPLIQDVPAAGFTAKEVEDAITDALKPGYMVDPKVTVDIKAFRNIYILGEVSQPGQYPYVPNMTAMQAVATAGGYTYRAREGTAEVTRHVKGALNTFTIDDRAMIKPGDTIVIGRRWF